MKSGATREQPKAGELGSLATTNPLLILLSAPSGGGKTTLCQRLL